MTNHLCLRCLAHRRRTPVTLTDDTYTCPVCGFRAQVRRVSLADLSDYPALRITRIWWAAGQAHGLERINR